MSASSSPKFSAAAAYELDHMNSRAFRNSLGSTLTQMDAEAVKVAVVDYDFSLMGGAVSTIDLGKALPANIMVTDVFLDVLTSVTSGGSATMQVLAGATALTGAIAYASVTGVTKPALNGSAAGIKVSAAGDLQLAIATAALTAGKVRISVKYHVQLPN